MNPLRKGSRLGKYRLNSRLGDGASAVVWSARDLVEGRPVALKVVHPSVIAEYGRDAVVHEARLAARLEHPNILSIRNADWIEPYFVIATELGRRSVEAYESARRSPKLALSIVRDTAAGLAHAHERHVLHRDLKPANILLFAGPSAKLADFGTARLAPRRTGALTEVGTMGYMAPEQAYGRVTYASDVFSLGLTAYELITGRLPGWPFVWPFPGHAALQRRVPEPILRVIRRAVEVDAHRRFPDAIEFKAALDRALRSAEQVSVPRRRKRATVADPFSAETRWFRRKYGRQLDLAFDCHACGGPISEAMKHCPWCGTDRNSFAEVTRHPLICPDCERGVRAEWTACPWCYAGRFEGNGRKPRLDPLAVRNCRKKGCEGQLRRFMRYCPLCKTKVTRPWSEPDLPSCKRCRWPMAPRWRHCPWCGRHDHAALTIVSGNRRRHS